MLTLSLVIPVFNEENQIESCLKSIENQTVMPDEVIVVDNNCNDRTIEIVEKFKFVKVIKESRQGRGYARTTGFNEAKGDIIGRIDADSRLSNNWVEHVKNKFEEDDSLAGLTGLGITSFLPLISSLKTTLFSRGYFWYVHAGFHTITMWGANMAVRRNAWNEISEKVINDDDKVHEDQDVSLWIAGTGKLIAQDNKMIIYANGQSYINLKKAFHYRSLYINTKKIHILNGNIPRAIPTKSNFLAKTLGIIMLYVIGGIIIAIGTVLQIALLPFRPIRDLLGSKQKRAV